MNPDKRVRVEVQMTLVDETTDTAMFTSHDTWHDMPYGSYIEQMQPVMMKIRADADSQLGELGLSAYKTAVGAKGGGRQR